MGTNQSEAELERFLTAVHGTAELWDSASVNTVAVNVGGEWFSICTSCRLHLRGTRRLKPMHRLPRTARLMAVQESVPMADLAGWLRHALSGWQEIAGTRVHFAASADPLEQAAESRRSSLAYGSAQLFAQLSAPALPAPFVNAHYWHATGDTARDVLWLVDGRGEGIDAELASSSNPWKDLTHLIRGVDAYLQGWTTGTSIIFEAVAPLGVAIAPARCMLRGGQLRLSVAAQSRAAARLASVGFNGDDESGRIVNGTMPTPAKDWSSSGDIRFLESTHRVGRLRDISLFLRVKGTTTQRLYMEATPERPNPLRAAHAVHHPASEESWRRHLLRPDRSQQKEFERAVARLFGFMGFGVDFLGDEKDPDCADLIASLGPDHLLVIECTTSTIKGDGKLAKLVRRTADLRAGLREKGVAVSVAYEAPPNPATASFMQRKASTVVHVVPLIICAPPFESLATGEIRDAETSGVIVLSREDLNGLLVAVNADADCKAVLADLITGRFAFPLVAQRMHGRSD